MTEKDKKKLRVLFVCTGNTCRSPMAEGILRSKLKQKGVKNVETSSAGTHGLHFAPASDFASHVAQAKGVNISRHRSRCLTREIIEDSDLILVMSPEHLEHVIRMDHTAVSKTHLLKSFPGGGSSNAEDEPGVLSIKDPMGGIPEDYQRNFIEIEKEIERILPELLRRAAEA